MSDTIEIKIKKINENEYKISSLEFDKEKIYKFKKFVDIDFILCFYDCGDYEKFEFSFQNYNYVISSKTILDSYSYISILEILEVIEKINDQINKRIGQLEQVNIHKYLEN